MEHKDLIFDVKKLGHIDDEVNKRCMGVLDNSTCSKELEVMCAEIALEYIGQLKYRPQPPKPTVLLEFLHDSNPKDKLWKRKSKDEKSELKKKVYSYPIVRDYVDKCMKISSLNYANACTLEEYMRIWLDWDETEKARQCWVVYNVYPDLINAGEHCMWEKKRKDYGVQ